MEQPLQISEETAKMGAAVTNRKGTNSSAMKNKAYLNKSRLSSRMMTIGDNNRTVKSLRKISHNYGSRARLPRNIIRNDSNFSMNGKNGEPIGEAEDEAVAPQMMPVQFVRHDKKSLESSIPVMMMN